MTFETMDQALAEIATLGLPIHITELDVNSAAGGQRGFGADISANASATRGGLWTPGGPAEASGSGAIWTPGSTPQPAESGENRPKLIIP